jgi:hypothetical protein
LTPVGKKQNIHTASVSFIIHSFITSHSLKLLIHTIVNMKFSSFALLPAIALASPIELIESQAPGQITIETSTYSGNGCPQGSVSSIISPDKTTITFGFDRFQAAIGPTAPQNGQQKNCQLHLNLRYPGGYQMSIMTATYHGFVRLDEGVEANFISQYYFSQAASKTVSYKKPFTFRSISA